MTGRSPFGPNYVEQTFVIYVGDLAALDRYGGAYTLKMTFRR